MDSNDQKYFISQLSAISAHIDTLKACIDSIDQRINEITDEAWFDADEFESKFDDFGLCDEDYDVVEDFNKDYLNSMSDDEFFNYFKNYYDPMCNCNGCQRYAKRGLI